MAVLFVRQAEQIVCGNVIQLREPDHRPDRDLPDTGFVPAVDLRMHGQIFGDLFLCQIMVFPKLIQTRKIHTITQVNATKRLRSA